jgi:hypothetical protein
MTGREMIDAFGLNYASEINASVSGFLDSEILAFLNQAKEDLVLSLCENGQLDFIEPLRTIQTETVLASHAFISNMKIVAVDPYFFPIKVYAKFDKNDKSYTVECRDFRSKKNNIGKYISDEGNKPVFNIPIWFINDTNLSVMVDAYSELDSLSFEYIAFPDLIVDTTDEITDIVGTMHGKIVDRAVTLAIETMANPRLQTQPTISA